MKCMGGGNNYDFKFLHYSLGYVNIPSLKELIMSECDDAFLEKHIENKELVSKIRIAAEMLVAYDANILGYCAFYANNPKTKDVYITLIAVKPMYQNKHIGKRLLRSLVDMAISRGMLTISLEVKKDNRKAIAFYIKNGFAVVGEKTGISYLISKSLESEAMAI